MRNQKQAKAANIPDDVKPYSQTHRMVPFEVSGDPSSSSTPKYGYQSINESDENFYHENSEGQYASGEDYLLGPTYDDDLPLQAPPPENIGTFVIGDEDSTMGKKKKMLYPPAIPKKSDHDMHPMRLGMYFAAFLLLVALFYSAATLTRSFTCLGAPYLYITHKGSKNILKFSRDGCLIHEKVLWGVAHEDADLRGMVVGKYQGEEALYVADSAAGESGVLLYGKCFESTSLRPFLDRVVSYKENRGADHAYGVTIDGITGDIYASFQDTDVILRFSPEIFTPIPNELDLLPIFLKKDNKSDSSTKKTPAASLLRKHRQLLNNANVHANKQYSDTELAKLHVGSPDEEQEEEQEEQEIAKELPMILTKDKTRKTMHGLHHSKKGRSSIDLDPRRVQPRAKSKLSKSSTTASVETKKSLMEDHRYLQTEEASSSTNSAETDGGTEMLSPSTKNSSSTDKTSQKHKTSADYNFYPGTFVQFGKPGFHAEKERGIRSIVWTKNFTEVWIANEDLDSIVIVNRTGKLVGKVSVGKPIGLHYSNESRADWVFVGSKGSKTGQVYAINIFTRTIDATFKYIGMKHPAGITSYQDVLFVGDQTRNNVVTFNITTGRVIRLIIPAKRIDGEIEQLTLSGC